MEENKTPVTASQTQQEQAKKANPEYLGSAFKGKLENMYYLHIQPSKVAALEPNDFGNIKVSIVEFTKDSSKSYGAYVCKDSQKKELIPLILELKKDKLLSLPQANSDKGVGEIRLVTSNKNPSNIRGDKQDIVVYANKYTSEMKDWDKEKIKEATRPKAEDYVGGGWKINQDFHRTQAVAQKSSKESANNLSGILDNAKNAEEEPEEAKNKGNTPSK